MVNGEHSPVGKFGVLILDPDEVTRAIISGVIRQRGLVPFEAQSGTEALDLGRRMPGPIRLVIADVALSDGGAPIADALLKILEPVVKVIGLYAEDQPSPSGQDIKECAAVLKKPFTVTSLTDAIERVLRE